MKITRREANKSLLASAVLPLIRFPKGENEVPTLELRCVLGREWQTGCIDLTLPPYDLHRKIYKLTWWPDGNSQGVFDSIKVSKGVRYDTSGLRFDDRYYLTATGMDNTEKCCEVEIDLKDGNFLRLNRFWVEIVNSKHTIIGSSIGFPTGYYGYRDAGISRLFGAALSDKIYYGKFICPAAYMKKVKTDSLYPHVYYVPPEHLCLEKAAFFVHSLPSFFDVLS